MHLLYVLPEFPPDFGGGIATVYGRLLPSLAATGHNITVLLVSRERLDQPRYCWQGVEVVPVQRSKLVRAQEEFKGWRHHAFLNHFLPLAWAGWYQAQDLGTFDVVEATDWALLFMPWLVQQRNQPVVVSLHGSCGQVDWHGNPGARSGEGQMVRLLETAVLPLADAVIANSTLNAEFWWRQCGVRAVVIPPLLPALDPVPAVQRCDRGVVVGRLQNWKGPELLCEALRLAPEQQIDWIGADTPWEAGPLTTSAHLQRRYPDVLDRQLHLLGVRPPDSVREQIRMAAFLCVPSMWDVFNVTVLEALAVGTPVICSNQAGACMCIQDAENGFVVDPVVPSQLAHAFGSARKLISFSSSYSASVFTCKQLFCTGNENRVRAHLECHQAILAAFNHRPSPPWLLHIILNGADALTEPVKQPFLGRLAGRISSIMQSLRT